MREAWSRPVRPLSPSFAPFLLLTSFTSLPDFAAGRCALCVRERTVCVYKIQVLIRPGGRRRLLSVSFLEIYNDDIHDLLDDSPKARPALLMSDRR